VLEVLDGAAVRSWCLAGRDALLTSREQLDALNVYPVPDGDTGANLLATMESVVAALEHTPDDLTAMATAIARSSLMGARGNSGVILSQLLRGLADVWSGQERVDGPTLREALLRGASSAYDAVATPVEGTILTVARVAAQSAEGATLLEVIRSAVKGATTAVAQTTEQLPALRAAGVVDAAGLGWCLLLEALEHLIADTTAPVATTAAPLAPAALLGVRETGSDEFDFEVMLLLSGADDSAVTALRVALGGLGDSLVIVGQDGLHKVHVHVNDVDAALAAAAAAGATSHVEVTRFSDPG
jgi:dihydroxyacetone kinase-like predicted kinase